MRRKSAGGPHGHDRVADTDPGGLGAERDDGADEFRAWRKRRRRLPLILASDKEQIREIETRRGDGDERLAGSRSGISAQRKPLTPLAGSHCQ
jgi:hypothetical protein